MLPDAVEPAFGVKQRHGARPTPQRHRHTLRLEDIGVEADEYRGA